MQYFTLSTLAIILIIALYVTNVDGNSVAESQAGMSLKCIFCPLHFLYLLLPMHVLCFLSVILPYLKLLNPNLTFRQMISLECCLFLVVADVNR